MTQVSDRLLLYGGLARITFFQGLWLVPMKFNFALIGLIWTVTGSLLLMQIFLIQKLVSIGP